MSKPLYIFLSFDLGQRRVRLKPLKRDRVVDDGSTLGRASANLTRRFEAVSPKQELLPNFELDCLITLSDKYLKEVGEVTVLQKEIAQPQVVIQPDGRINIPKKEDGSVWTLEELREKMKWSRWPMFDELEPLFRRWWELRYKDRFHRYWTVEELMEMKDIQQFLGLDYR